MGFHQRAPVEQKSPRRFFVIGLFKKGRLGNR